ncbi:MAG: hypothetical protein A3G41_03025 [Elusimicrobia bacterium RIFCSPLOWO2_12_FULL_59_9]|nr:MAG: hypothetical protein A3G41_03025 [Elusimicrobia bacterium RIFCSPLOWO2_12_FULL_59_9]
MSRGNGGQKTFLNADDYSAFLKILAEIKRRKPFHLYAYCLMPNHFHLLLEVDHAPLSLIMQRLLTSYCKHFNIVYKRLGHLFQGRYKAILCQKDLYLVELIRYIHLNPVRASLANSPSAWRWSGHHDYISRIKPSLTDTGFPLSLFGANAAQAREAYVRFLADGIGTKHDEDFYPSPSLPCLGNEDFVSDYRSLAGSKSRGMPNLKYQPTIAQLSAELSAKVPMFMLRSKSKAPAVTAARRSLTLRALEAGHAPGKIAEFLNYSASAVSKIIARNIAGEE